MGSNAAPAPPQAYGYYERQFVVVQELPLLRCWVDLTLQEQGRTQQQAATQAGVTLGYWSRIRQQADITESVLQTLARGLGKTTEEVLREASSFRNGEGHP